MKKIKELLENKKKRPLIVFLFVLPFIIVIGICGFLIYEQAMNIIGMATSDVVATKNTNYSINDGSFALRDNATDIQKEYFSELKDLYENTESQATDTDKVVSTIKNFVADFYTWSNKVGQYDVGGLYYVYHPQRKTIYIQARDQFYKYINEYINEYGASALLEVASVEVSVDGSEFAYILETTDSETGEVVEDEVSAFKASATWTYVEKEGGFQTSKYDTKANFVVINNHERFEIIYMNDKEYTPNVEE